jgi:tRNA(Ile)-lysidine synthase
MTDLSTEFTKNWTVKAFAAPGGKTLLAVSGGLDSMVLSHLFLQSGLPLAIAHCNFQLRGADADGDEAFVKEWAEKHGVPFFSTRFDTQLLSEEWKKGIQETARIVRYEWLDEQRKTGGYQHIATAHHANDNAETLLINLFKGTGISGLHAIPEVNEHIIRPLLFATRKDIEQYAKERGIEHREDVSNATDKYLRNAVRLNILPVVEQHFPNVIERLKENIQRFTQVELLYNEEVKRQVKRLTDKRGKDLYIPVRKLQKTQALETICYELFHPYGFSAAQVPQIVQLVRAESGHFMTSPTHKLIKDREFLILTVNNAADTDLITIEGAPCNIEAGKYHFHFSITKKPQDIPASAFLALIDASKITYPLILRKWRTGDYFYPLGMGMKKKKLSKFFIDQKLPVHEKENVWVLECQKRIVWVAGMRLDERFKLRPSTHQVLKIEQREA